MVGWMREGVGRRRVKSRVEVDVLGLMMMMLLMVGMGLRGLIVR